jgi:hypothetical protein
VVGQFADFLSSATSTEIPWDKIKASSLYATIGRILEGNALPAINVAMLCLNNLLKSAPSEVALEFFGDFTGGPIMPWFMPKTTQRLRQRLDWVGRDSRHFFGSISLSDRVVPTVVSPFDRHVFGVMKSYGRQQWRHTVYANEGERTIGTQMREIW